jgi:transcriptional regulator with XRE-family HTH domain
MFSGMALRRSHAAPSTVRGGVSLLRELTGLTKEQLAARLYLTLGQMIRLESVGTPLRTETLQRLIAVAQDYYLDDLAVFFGECELRIRSKSLRTREGKRS